ncbi:MAG: YabP/YqfC family sporulation protein [Lachnospiraceae bacterium]|nr:YabP/YqfC family sporulation protein [Lachnospiraceae bacterium]
MKWVSDRFSVMSIAHSLQLPEDYRRGRTIVSMEGRERVCIENFGGICSYTEEEIRLRTRKDKIRVTGRRLQIDCYSRDEIEISGHIQKVDFEDAQ